MFKKKDEEQVEEEILSMVEEGQKSGFIQEDEVEMISNILDLDDMEVREIMTNRSKIYAVSFDAQVKDIIEDCLESGYSRYPVFEEDIDNIVGILHLKDMTKQYIHQPDTPVNELMEEALFIHPAFDTLKLLKKMQKEKKHMAIVLDEYGQTDGLVTLEDVLEEIVGNIWDEHDAEVEEVREAAIGDGYVVDGMIKLHDLEDEIDGLEFPDTDIETLNGFLLYKLGGFPKDEGNIKIDYGGFSFESLSIEDKLIKSVKITKNKDEDL
ncbi:putative hemolysin [Lachnospiraceae bacterium NE2001]|nr:putative hemolysin [Lachnospiraceae bacterium NE2001]